MRDAKLSVAKQLFILKEEKVKRNNSISHLIIFLLFLNSLSKLSLLLENQLDIDLALFW